MTTRILTGDCRDVLRTLPDESVHCVVTSPPYWGLRDYGVDGQIGLEPSFSDYIDTMRAVFAEVWRVLRKDGTLWLNMGDSYATSVNGRSAADTKATGNDDRTFRDKPFSTIGPIHKTSTLQGGKEILSQQRRVGDLATDFGILKPKDLCGIPWRIAFALQADGWYLRSDIIWSKPNPMPESVIDRPTKAHEYLFLLSKSERYYYDADAIREPHLEPERSGTSEKMWSPNVATNEQLVNGGFGRGKYTQRIYNSAGRNRRTVWEIPTSPYSEAHFATFPPALIEPCIKAGCPKDGWVLDPFGGAGTTGLVADRLGRNAILIELNPQYAAMAERRIQDDAGLFYNADPILEAAE